MLECQRTRYEDYFPFSYRTNGYSSRGFYSMSGTASFAQGNPKTEIRFRLDQTPQDDPQTKFSVTLFDNNVPCACEVRPDQSSIEVTVINDLKWSYVHFRAVDVMNFNYSDRCALFEVIRRLVGQLNKIKVGTPNKGHLIF